jgi:hypothetical protein
VAFNRSANVTEYDIALRASARRVLSLHSSGWTSAATRSDNATLYGKRLEDSEIVTKGVRPPNAAPTLLELLNRYSAKERKSESPVAA